MRKKGDKGRGRRRACGRGRGPGARGMVTVELAAASLLLATFVSGCLMMAGAAFSLARCQLVANEVARQEARSDSAGVARATAEAPSGARVTTSHEGGASVVSVRLDYGVGPAVLPLEARASVLDEAG